MSDPRIILFGATGYTGRLTAASLVRRGAKPLLAGRNAERLDELAAELEGGLETGVADVGDPDSISSLLERGDVLISTVGPFTRWGDAAAEAAVAAGAHYLDSSGEAPFHRRVFEEYGPRAERVGLGMLTGFGNDWVPGNLAGATVLEEVGDRATRVDIGYFAFGGGAGGGFSSGTRATAITTISEPSFAWHGGRIVSERLGRKAREFDLNGRSANSLSVGGTEHYALPRIAPGLDEVNVYLGWFGGMTTPLRISSALASAGFKLPGSRRAFRAVTDRLLKRTGTGPDAAARAAASSLWIACAYDEAGDELSQVRFEGPDAYSLTGDLLAWGAEQAAAGELNGSGALGPVDGFGLSALREGCEEIGLRQANAMAPAT